MEFRRHISEIVTSENVMEEVDPEDYEILEIFNSVA
jgi:Asp-tRNA(Asn)/Glu-tRNA(Gln) amidotransferase C subunit